MSGAPGSGKSTTANLLAPKIDAYTIPHDTIKSALLEENIAFDQAAKIAYRIDWALAEDLMRQGRSVILDSVCNYQEALDQGSALARKYRYAYWYVEIRAGVDDLALLDGRLRSRTSLRAQRTSVEDRPSDANGMIQEDGQERLKKWMNPCRPDNSKVIVVAAAGSLDERIDYILEQLSAGALRTSSARA
jgi:predicted kinase